MITNINKVKEITIEIDGKVYHGFLFEVDKARTQSFYLEHPIEELDYE